LQQKRKLSQTSQNSEVSRLHLTTANTLHKRLTASDLDLRIKNSRVGLLSWTHAAVLNGVDGEHIVLICDTEIGLLQGLRALSADQQIAVDLLIHRWSDLRAQCDPSRTTPRRTHARRRLTRSAV
jgi:hypothetical protein